MVQSRRIVASLFVSLAVIVTVHLFKSHNCFPIRYAADTMSLTHTVLFQFKAEAMADDVKAACTRFLALKDNCIHPMTGTRYIVSLKGGKDNSPEMLQNGISHGFVVEFASTEDRDYYVTTDPAHQAFVKSIGNLVEKAIVVDFSDGVY
ncbi:hypothetical protein V8C42DRAFT_333037 [Trichoderma barbatum]